MIIGAGVLVVVVAFEDVSENCELALLAVAFVFGDGFEVEGSELLEACKTVSCSITICAYRMKIEFCGGKGLSVNHLRI